MNSISIHFISLSYYHFENSCVLFNFVFYIILCKLHFNPPICFCACIHTHARTISHSLCLFLTITLSWLITGNGKSVRCSCCWCVIDISPMLSFKMHGKMNQCSTWTRYIQRYTYCCFAILSVFLSYIFSTTAFLNCVSFAPYMLRACLLMPLHLAS